MSNKSGRQAMTRLSIGLLSALMLAFAALACYGCRKSESIGGPDLESPEDTFLWSDTSEVEIRIVEIRGDSVKIIELRSFRDTNRIYTSQRYTTEELDSWHRDNMVRFARIEPDLVEALKMLTDSNPACAGKE